MKTIAHVLFLMVALSVGSRGADVPAASTAIEPRPGALLDASLRLAEVYWDESAGLLRSPNPRDERKVHRSRESAWYALGLLLRDAAGDRARAIRIMEEVLALQIVAPGQPWDGTFRRAPEEGIPETGAQLWTDYDPNWRAFIGTTFAIVLSQFEQHLPPDLSHRLLASIRRSVQTELAEGRAEAYHTNIALMHSFLWGWAGARLGRTEWVEQSEAWAQRIHAKFRENRTFEEYNSPTYYGVDLYGLALWRRYGATESVRAWGAEMETRLWRDIAQFYHAGMRNLCGPFDRAYGLDQMRYVSLTGIWMGFELEPARTPLPDPTQPMQHAHDFFCTPNFVAVGSNMPTDVLQALSSFQGERTLHRVITKDRIATAWLSPNVMLGGETTAFTRGAGPKSGFGQFHPATGHWLMSGDHVGAFALMDCPPVNARAEPSRLQIETRFGASTFRIAARGVNESMIGRERWALPNLVVEIETDAKAFSVAERDGYFEVIYTGATRFDLRSKHQW